MQSAQDLLEELQGALSEAHARQGGGVEKLWFKSPGAGRLLDPGHLVRGLSEVDGPVAFHASRL